MTGQTIRRNPALDVLRAFAVLWVVLHHMPGMIESVFGRGYFYGFTTGGWVGVDLFFVMSGLLISRPLFFEWRSTGSVDPIRFLIRRGFKIYPSFFLYLIVETIIAVRISIFTWGKLVSEVTFMQSYKRGLATHTWSLSVEEQFYFLIALMFSALAAGRIHIRTIPRLFFLVAAGCGVVRGVFFLGGGGFDTYRFALGRFDSLAFGVLIAYALECHDVFKSRLFAIHHRWWLFGGFAGYALIFSLTFQRSEMWANVIMFPLLYLFFGMIVISACINPHVFGHRGWVSKGLQIIGQGSYNIYLWHLIFVSQLNVPLLGILGSSQAACLVASFTASVVVGLLITRWLEEPMLRWRNRLYPSLASGSSSKRAA